MAKRKNRIDFYKTLVCPDEVRSGEVDFFDWCNDVISAESYLEKRSYLLLEFYSAFRKIYEYFTESFITNDIYKMTCDFNEDEESMTVTVKYQTYTIEKSFIDDLYTNFSPCETDDYDRFELETKSEKHNIVKLVFYKD